MSGYEFADHDELGSDDASTAQDNTTQDDAAVPTLACGSVDEFVRDHLMLDYGSFIRTHQGNLSGIHFGCFGVSGAI